jgi:hypothetical protein
MVEAASRHVWRNRVLPVLAALCCALLLAVLALRALRETGDTNAYAVMAESFLKGTPDVSKCVGADCAFVDGKTYVVFPPLPGVLAVPMVWLNGVATPGFIALSVVMFALSLWLWNGIFVHQGLEPAARRWLLVALGFASPLYYVALRGDGIWFFAQSCAFLLVTLALHQVLVKGRLFTAGLALGGALLCRQMSVFYAPLLLLLWLPPGEPLLRIDGRRLRSGLALGLPIALGLVFYFAYNYWRFHDPLDTGYRFLKLNTEPLQSRLATYGLWNKAYLLFNLFYLFLQGFHVEFIQPMQVRLQGMDPSGTSLLAASPWLLLSFFIPWNRNTLAVLVLVAGFAASLLFYHSNGFSQYNVQRYTLDWLPALLVVLAPALTLQRLEWVRLLVLWGLVLNVATVAVLALTRAA